MSIGIIIFFVVLIIVYIFLAFFFRKLFRIVSIISFVLFIILVIFGFFLYLDFRDIQKNFPDSNNTFILDIDGELAGGFKVFNGLEPEYLSGLDSLNAYYQQKDFDAVKQDSYLLMIVQEEALASAADVDIAGYTFTREECFDMLRSDSPMTLFAGRVLETEKHATMDLVVEQLEKRFDKDDQFKSMITASLFANSLSNSGGLRIIDGIQKGYIRVYPNKLVFKMIKFIPKSIVQDIVSGMEIKNGE